MGLPHPPLFTKGFLSFPCREGVFSGLVRGQGAGVCTGVIWVTLGAFLFWTAGWLEPCTSAPWLGGSTSGCGRGRRGPLEGSRSCAGLPGA